MKVTDPDRLQCEDAEEEDAETEDGDNINPRDGRRRRSAVTNERKQAFGKKNETLNLRKV